MTAEFHRERAEAVNQQIAKLSIELKQQERIGWESFVNREEQRAQNSRSRSMGGTESSWSIVDDAANRSFGNGNKMKHSRSGPAPRNNRGKSSAAAAAAKLTLPRTPGGGDGSMAVVEDVVKKRIVPTG